MYDIYSHNALVSDFKISSLISLESEVLYIYIYRYSDSWNRAGAV